MESYRYETHLHTFPVSKCAKKPWRKTFGFTKKLNYRGVLITNHFINRVLDQTARPFSLANPDLSVSE